MKSKVLFVATAAIILFIYISCKWFDSSSKHATPFIGKWLVVNVIDSASDSSKNAVGLLLLAQAAKDSLQIEFETDSIYKALSANRIVDSGRYVYETAEDRITFISAYDTTLFKINAAQNDSLSLRSEKDSVVYLLKKLR